MMSNQIKDILQIFAGCVIIASIYADTFDGLTNLILFFIYLLLMQIEENTRK